MVCQGGNDDWKWLLKHQHDKKRKDRRCFTPRPVGLGREDWKRGPVARRLGTQGVGEKNSLKIGGGLLVLGSTSQHQHEKKS